MAVIQQLYPIGFLRVLQEKQINLIHTPRTCMTQYYGVDYMRLKEYDI